MSLSEVWARALQAAQLAQLDPAFGGIVIRARSGPVRDALLDGLGPCTRIHPAMTDDVLSGGLDVTATLASGAPVTRQGLLQPGAPLLLTMAERCTPGMAARLSAHIDRHGGPLFAVDEGASDDETLPSALADRLAFHVDLSDVPLAAVTSAPTTGAVSLGQISTDGTAQIAAAADALGVTGLRALLHCQRAARWLAGLSARRVASGDDIMLACQLVLAPRATRFPDDAAPPPDQTPDTQSSDPAQSDTLIPDDMLIEALRAILPLDLLDRVAAQRARNGRGNGSGATRRGNRRGRPLPARPGRKSDANRIDLMATLRAAAPWQTLRRTSDRTGLQIRSSDIHIKRFDEKSDRLLIFCVDASGSSALARLGEAKGAIELLLAQAYARRDHVALVAFRGTGAELLLPPTRSLVQTKRRLAELPGGGGTPLALGLETALSQAIAANRRGLTPTICLLTDGRANVARDGRGDRTQAAEDADQMARLIRAQGVDALVIDTGQRPSAPLRTLAHTLSAPYLPLPRADAQRLSDAVTSALAG